MLNIKKFKPAFNYMLTTMDVYAEDEYRNGLIEIKKGSIKEYQTVLATGPSVREVKVGDVVLVNPKRFIKMKHEAGSLKDGIVTDNMKVGYDFEVLEVDGKPLLFITDSDIKGIVEEYTEEKGSKIEVPKQDIIIAQS